MTRIDSALSCFCPVAQYFNLAPIAKGGVNAPPKTTLRNWQLCIDALHPESFCLKVCDRRKIKTLCNRAKARQGLINANHECTVSYEGIQHSTERGQEYALQDKKSLFSPRCFFFANHKGFVWMTVFLLDTVIIQTSKFRSP